MQITIYRTKKRKERLSINIYDIWFSNLDISNRVKIKLLEDYGNSKNVWELEESELVKNEVNSKYILKILDKNNRVHLDKYLTIMERYSIKLVSCNDFEYPTSLKYIENKPAYLYVRGKIENLYDDCVAIVGSRNASSYGKFVAKKISKEIADRNVNVVSGLAVGIDKYAHLGALESKIGKTIAVLGSGILDSDLYPLENKKVFERILENNGTIITEFKLGCKPEKYNFPLRNRIISGISKKIIVVEAKENSGSLITVNYALEQGKEVFAVPGNITSINSKGTNNIIFEGARIFRDVEDIFNS